MDTERELEVLRDWLRSFNESMIGKRRAERSTVAERMRVDVVEDHIATLMSKHQVVATLSELGKVVEQQGDSISVLVKAGWLRMNRALVTCSWVGSGTGLDVHLRAAALEGKISNHSARGAVTTVKQRLA